MANSNGNPQSEVEIALEKQLTQADSSIRVGGTSPDLLIDCGVSRYGAPQRQQSSENGQTVTRLVATLSVEFRMTELITHRVIKSDIATSEYAEEIKRSVPAPATKPTTLFGISVPGAVASTPAPKSPFKTDEELRRFVISEVARKIASYVVITAQPVDIVLATGGPLDEPNKFALNGLWSRDLEELETLPAQTDARKDANRLYDIGVANEALAYQASDVKSALTYLQEASINYGKALDANPGEKSFLEAQTRIKEGLGQYTTINTLGPADEHHGSAGPPPPSQAAPPVEAPIKDEDIIDMVKNKVPEADVIDTIQNAPAVDFDLTPKGLIRLTQGGVNSKVTQAMRQRVRMATPAPTK